jgi:Ca-activated chloride channel homolog
MFLEGGNTAVVDAVRYAVERVAERGGEGRRRRAVVLITDGEDRESHWKPEELAKLLRQQNVQVFVLAFVHLLSNEGGFIAKGPREKAVALMTRIAEESGGRAFFPKDAATLKTAVEEIVRNLRTQYTVEYRPTNAARDGKFRKVQVKAAGDRRVFARPGYFAEK